MIVAKQTSQLRVGMVLVSVTDKHGQKYPCQREQITKIEHNLNGWDYAIRAIASTPAPDLMPYLMPMNYGAYDSDGYTWEVDEP